MPATFATIMLSRLSLAVAVLFAANAWKVFSLDRKAPANRVALVFNMVFALWALAASFWYGTSNRETAHMLYNFFSWTWCVFPPLILHFTVLVSDVRPRWAAGKVKLALLVLLYVPSVALALALPGRLIDEPAYRGGYWMLAVRHNGWYIAFILHYFLLVLASVVLAFRTSARSAASRVRKRLRILAWSYLAAGLLGFVTDTLFLALGVDFPNMAIIWIAILSIGMLTAMERHGLLTILPAKEALRVLSGMSGLVAYVDDAGKLIWANQSALDALGMDELEGARGLSLQDFLPEQAVAGIEGAKGTGSQPAEARCSFGPQGIPVSLRARVLGGRTEGVVLSAVDLRPERERARVERRLADADLVLDEFISRSLDGIALTDAAGTIVRWNEAMAHITGIPVGKALGMPYWEARAAIEPPEARSPERIRKAIDSALAGERARWTRRIVESEIVRGDGARRILQSDSFTLPLAEGLILATIARDVTDEKRQIEENIERVRNLDRAQKLEAIGTLSGGIAHDFNNTLAGIIGALSIIKQEIESGACSDPREL